MRQFEVLVGELVPVDGLSSGSVVVGEVTSLALSGSERMQWWCVLVVSDLKKTQATNNQ